MLDKDFYWLVGLLEGEGCFLRPAPKHPNQPRICLSMTDEDVVQRVGILWSKRYHCVIPKNPRHKPTYVVNLSGRAAVAMMKLLLPHMSIRRREAIERAIAAHDPGIRERMFISKRILSAEAVDTVRERMKDKKNSLRAEAKRLGVHHETLRRRLG